MEIWHRLNKFNSKLTEGKILESKQVNKIEVKNKLETLNWMKTIGQKKIEKK